MWYVTLLNQHITSSMNINITGDYVLRSEQNWRFLSSPAQWLQLLALLPTVQKATSVRRALHLIRC